MLAPVAFVAAFVLAPVAGAQAADPPANVAASYVGATPSVNVTFDAPLDVTVTGFTARVCQPATTCTFASRTSETAGVSSPIDVPLPDAGSGPLSDSGCLVQVRSESLLGPSDWVPAAPGLLVPTCDTVAPVVTGVTETGADGCTSGLLFTITGATAADGSPVTFKVNGVAMPPDYLVPGGPFDLVSPSVIATDAAGLDSAPFVAPQGHVNDPTGPGAVSLEVNTDPPQQQATLTWEPVVSDGAAVTYHLRIKGPQGVSGPLAVTSPVTRQNLEDDATYEFTLEAVDECNRTTSSVRLVRLNDSTPPSMPLLGTPGFNPAKHTVALSWVASSDNIQVDHYVVLRDGVPLGVTDTTGFTDLVPPQHTRLNYAVRAVDTNGNATDSAPAPLMTPDWTQPSAPLPTATVAGTTVTLRWPPATDNVGVVSYLVMRDDTQIATMTAAVRTYRDANVRPGVHTWRVLARDDAQLTASSAPITRKISKATVRASVLSLRMVGGGGSSAARYSLKPPGRLLVDVRVVGTLVKPRLRLYVNSGRGRITVWRGVPGTSTPRTVLGSGIARHGFVMIHLNHALHAGHIRLVLIAGGRVVIAGKGGYRPAMNAG
jgi:hypothetical protein